MLIALSAATIALLAYAAWSDVAARIIPNTVCGAVAALGLVTRASEGLTSLEWSLAVAAVLFVLLFLIYIVGGMGGGDVKLATAMVFGLSPADAYRFVFWTALAGGVLGLAYLVMRRLPAPVYAGSNMLPRRANLLKRVYIAERWRIRRRGPLPYGVAIATGGWLTLVHVFGR